MNSMPNEWLEDLLKYQITLSHYILYMVLHENNIYICLLLMFHSRGVTRYWWFFLVVGHYCNYLFSLNFCDISFSCHRGLSLLMKVFFECIRKETISHFGECCALPLKRAFAKTINFITLSLIVHMSVCSCV